MDRVHMMTAFVAVAEEQNFAAAARRLGASPATVTRAIASLEEHLGVKLMQRTTRSVKLSDAGGRYLDDAEKRIELLTRDESGALKTTPFDLADEERA